MLTDEVAGFHFILPKKQHVGGVYHRHKHTTAAARNMNVKVSYDSCKKLLSS